MPTFEFSTKDGRTFQFDAPDPLTAASKWKSAQALIDQPAAKSRGLIDVAQGGAQVAAGAAEATPGPSALDSFNTGVRDTATFGFGDELSAGIQTGAGLWGDYGKKLDETRAAMNKEQAANPGWYVGGQFAGVAPSLVVPGGAATRAATLLPRLGRAALEGAAYGGAYGAGSADGGLPDRAAGAGMGAITGGLLGGASAGAVEGVGAGARAAWNRVSAPVRGAFAPEAEASRRLGIAMAADNATPQPRMTAQDEIAAIRNGQPIMNIDRGGETTRAMARSAANTSPQARATLESAVDPRFATQGDRTVDVVRNIVGTGTTTDARARLIADAAAANRPAYARAYADPQAQALWDQGLEQLSGAPIVQDAIRQATVTGKNAGALGGWAPFRNPFVTDPATGRLTLAVDAKGNKVIPNLEFWDHVKRNLDAVGTREAKQAAKVLRDHLDQLVPAYGQARTGAAKFFGAQDALEAGDMFVGSRMGNDEARVALGKMNGAERKLFAEGFADSLTRRVQESGDRRNVINSLFLTSAASRQRIELALGPQRAKELEAFLRTESYMDRARTALSGNSTTARQLTELGLAGGAGLALSGGNVTDPKFLLTAALVRGGRAGFRAIDSRVANEVARLLVSDDPQLVQRGIQMVANNNALFFALRALDRPASLAGAQAGVNNRSVVFKN